VVDKAKADRRFLASGGQGQGRQVVRGQLVGKASQTGGIRKNWWIRIRRTCGFMENWSTRLRQTSGFMDKWWISLRQTGGFRDGLRRTGGFMDKW
jgi:hypothetical protein